MKLELESVWILIILLSFLQIPVSISETFRVLGPAGPVVAAAGEDTVLPCYLSPSISVLDLEIRWFRGDFSELVFLYRKHKNLFDYQLPSYKGRTDLFPEEFPRGNASLSLKDVRGTDDGLYTCLVQSADWYKEAMIDLAVRALGTQPSVSLHSTGGGQTQLVCRSEGWFPAPAVTWTDRDGQDVTSLSSTTVERDSRGLLSVSSYLPVKQESNIFSCLVRSSVPYPDRGSLLHISEDISPGPSGWMVALLLTLILSVGLTNLLIKKWRKLHDFPQLHKELDRVTRCCKSGNVHCVGLANNIQQPYHPATHNWQPAEAKQSGSGCAVRNPRMWLWTLTQHTVSSLYQAVERYCGGGTGELSLTIPRGSTAGSLS
ncbi:butyrophilin subfamily 3 member A2-like isoform X4 [Lepisosteus oculatus]|uniref:butyrophilin subfamily 3 member A2-like isoform X4 n=1 Tax=Lepisosteus oculatus TaxID=7918 RepID=UPI00372299E0